MEADWTSPDGTIRLWNRDNREWLPTLGPDSVDLFFTSPPYNLGNTTGGGIQVRGHYSETVQLGKRGGGGKWKAAARPGGLGHGYGTHDDNMPHDEYVAWQKSTLQQCWAALSDKGAIYYNHKPRVLGGRLVTPFDYIPDLPVRQVVIWARAGGINFTPAFYLPTHEWIVILAKDGFRLKSKGAAGIGDVWYVPQESNTDHPCAFPMELPLRALESTTARVVCDPFSGNGTVAIACLRMGREFMGCEQDPTHFANSIDRIEAELRQPRLFPALTPKETQGDLFAESAQ